MILTSMEILISRVEPRWLEAYSQILISNLQQALKNQLMAVGLKAVKCLHLIFVQLKDVSLFKRSRFKFKNDTKSPTDSLTRFILER